MARSDSSNVLRVEKETATLRELTTARLRDAILKMHFKPNQRLIERYLCEQTGVSRTSVREAVRHLESEGLVVRIPNRGIFVASVSLDQARQIYEVRAALEAAVGRLFAERADDGDIAALRMAVDDLETATASDPPKDYVEALDGFYEIMARGSGNAVARQILGTLRARINFLRAMTARKEGTIRRRETVRLLGEICEAAATRDAESTATRCQAFVERSARFACTVLTEQDDARTDALGSR